jgi:hypothetical protein
VKERSLQDLWNGIETIIGHIKSLKLFTKGKGWDLQDTRNDEEKGKGYWGSERKEPL